MFRSCAVLISMVVTIRAEMEPFIVGGALAHIQKYPHSAFLTVKCVMADYKITNWICGSSIVNQNLLLTAGHCIYGCKRGTHISINVGDEDRAGGIVRSASGFLVHEHYDAKTSSCDIGMIKMLRPLKFNSRVSRVALLRRPPYNEVAYLAGWGLTNENTKKQGFVLKKIDQILWKNEKCMRLFGTIPDGTICASSNRHTNFAAQGDSGSALMVRGYIQVGLVSYKVPRISSNVIIYTDIGYYYKWIMSNANRLFCNIKG